MSAGETIVIDGQTYVLGEQLAYLGKEGCENVRCRRRVGDSVCLGYHCPRCHEPCGSQGHRCKTPPKRSEGAKP